MIAEIISVLTILSGRIYPIRHGGDWELQTYSSFEDLRSGGIKRAITQGLESGKFPNKFVTCKDRTGSRGVLIISRSLNPWMSAV